MTTNIIDEIAQHIRIVDGGNKMPADALGREITMFLGHKPNGVRYDSADLVRFVARTNPDKALGASALAELIAAEFNLNQE